MSLPKKNTTWGTFEYQGVNYGVLNSPLNDDLKNKIENYAGNKVWIDSTAPWKTMQLAWAMEDEKLYLTKLYVDGLLEEITGNNRIFASWVDELILLKKDKKICKTYKKKGSYLNELTKLHLRFKDGVFFAKEEQTELYLSIEIKNYIDSNPAYATLRIGSSDLLHYLEKEHFKPKEDQLLPLMSKFIAQMIQKGNKEDISLDIEDVKSVLKKGEIAVLASAKGSDIDEMVGSLVDSVTDEALKAKGCIIHLTMSKDYPINSIKSIVNGFENKLGFDREDPLDPYIPNTNPFIFGTGLNDTMSGDEVLIRILLGV